MDKGSGRIKYINPKAMLNYDLDDVINKVKHITHGQFINLIIYDPKCNSFLFHRDGDKPINVIRMPIDKKNVLTINNPDISALPFDIPTHIKFVFYNSFETAFTNKRKGIKTDYFILALLPPDNTINWTDSIVKLARNDIDTDDYKFDELTIDFLKCLYVIIRPSVYSPKSLNTDQQIIYDVLFRTFTIGLQGINIGFIQNIMVLLHRDDIDNSVRNFHDTFLNIFKREFKKEHIFKGRVADDVYERINFGNLRDNINTTINNLSSNDDAYTVEYQNNIQELYKLLNTDANKRKLSYHITGGKILIKEIAKALLHFDFDSIII